jgi:hypothetical protein
VSYQSDNLFSIPLLRVVSWKRGSQPVISDHDSEQPFMRLTIDSLGVKEIEQLNDYPQSRSWRTDAYVFVVLGQACFAGVVAHLKVLYRKPLSTSIVLTDYPRI